jgi:hypothetical protein
MGGSTQRNMGKGAELIPSNHFPLPISLLRIIPFYVLCHFSVQLLGVLLFRILSRLRQALLQLLGLEPSIV